MKTMSLLLMLLLAAITVASAQSGETEQTPVQPAYCQEHGGCWDILIKSGPLADTMHAGVESELYPEMQNYSGRKIKTSDIHYMWGHWYIAKDAEFNEARFFEFTEFELNWLTAWRAKKTGTVEFASLPKQQNNATQITAVAKPATNSASVSATTSAQTAATTVADPLANCQHRDLKGLQEVCLDEQYKKAALDQQAEPASSKTKTWLTADFKAGIAIGLVLSLSLAALGFKLYRAGAAPQPKKRRYYSLWAWAMAKLRRMNEKAEARFLEKTAANSQPRTGPAPEIHPSPLPLGATEEPVLPQEASHIQVQEPCLEILVDNTKPHDFHTPNGETWDFAIFKKHLEVRLDKAVKVKGEWEIETNDQWTHNSKGEDCLPTIVITCLESDSTNVWEALNRYRRSSVPALALARCRNSHTPDGVRLRHFRLGCAHNTTTDHPLADQPTTVVPITQARLA